MTQEHCTAILDNVVTAIATVHFGTFHICRPVFSLRPWYATKQFVFLYVYICCVMSFPTCREVFRSSYGARNAL